MGNKREVALSWQGGGDPKGLARDLRHTKWAATSKGWIARPGQGDFPGYWIKVFNGRISFLWAPRVSSCTYKWDYTDPKEIGILLMQIVFNNSQNIRRVKES
jgi:hypothetical protein